MQQNLTILIQNDKAHGMWNAHLNQRVGALEKQAAEILKYLNTKDAKDKAQDSQIADFINIMNNGLSDLKANSHSHAVATET